MYEVLPFELLVLKRDGTTTQPFSMSKIETAISKAWAEVSEVTDNVRKEISSLSRKVSDSVGTLQASGNGPTRVEDIQDMVEVHLMAAKKFSVAKRYIIYREERSKLRQARLHPDPQAIAGYMHPAKYGRYMPLELRREVYLETTARVKKMHLDYFEPRLSVAEDRPDGTSPYGRVLSRIEEVFTKFVDTKRLLPSMRSLKDDTLIPTPTGWSTVGDIKVGDYVFDQEGKPTKVLGVQKFKGIPLYDVVFSDGAVLTASADHLWVTSTLDDRQQGKSPRVVSTQQIISTLHQKSGNPRYPYKNNHAVWNPKPLELPESQLPLDPYILGLWLGNGFSSGGQFANHHEDFELPAAYTAAGFSACKTSKNPHQWGTHGLATILRSMGLLFNKHVPDGYLRASYVQRLALVQGLLDTDGHTTPAGRTIFCNTNPRIFNAFLELIASLGIKPVVWSTPPTENHKEAWTAAFFTDLPVHRITRRLSQLRKDHRESNRYRSIQTVVETTPGDATCFLVESESHTYLAGPSMIVTHNCMQFAGPAQLASHARGYNCSSTYIDRPRVFQEVLYLLLCGCGVGYSVQKHHVSKLPPLMRFVPDKSHVAHFTIPDTIEGWADAVGALVTSVLLGYYVEFDYHLIRAKGTPLKTSGGRAPGHLPLKKSLEAVRGILYTALGRQLTSLECHDILCLLADAVLSGGIRRSAMISIFSLDDEEMLRCKTGRWYETSPWRQNANNSAMVLRDIMTREKFKVLFDSTKEWGEPGFYFSYSSEYVTNPCVEVGMLPYSFVYDASGFSFCNLVEINGAMIHTFEEYLEVAAAAAFLGTLQAAYISFPYLGSVTEEIVRRDALLGVGITGIMDSPEVLLDAENQTLAAGMVLRVNEETAKDLGINPAVRTTCVKPSGSTSLELGGVASGHHPHHARRYIRRITANEDESVFQYFRSINPHMCVRKPNGDWVIEFPVEAPEGAILKEDLGAVEFLKKVISTQVNWVRSGTRGSPVAPNLHHNVSNTVTVKPGEWEEVADFIWDNREFLTGVSLISATGDKDYAFAPNEAVVTEADELRWNQLLAHYTPVDYSAFMESEDGTNLTDNVACVGGACLT